MIRSIWLVILLAAIAVFTALAWAVREDPADFTYVNTADIHTLDPARMSWTPDFRVALNIWEGLTTWDPTTLQPVGAAAEFPPHVSNDGLTFTFTIRDHARWSNGDPVTSADFVRGWRRAIEPGTAADYAFLLTQHIVGAAEYVAWRHRAVTVSTALARRRDGWSISSQQTDQLNSLLETIEGDFDRAHPDWTRLHAQVLADHVAEREQRFAAVGMSAPDPRTLVVQLLRPCPFFLDLTGMPTFLPLHESIEHLRIGHEGGPLTAEGLVVYDPQWTKPLPRDSYPGLITNGPYHLKEWIFKRRARLAVNPFHHRAESIACRTVDMVVYDNINAAIMAYEAGRVDFLPSLAVSYDHEIARLSRSGERPDFHLCPVQATWYLIINTTDDTVEGRINPLVDRRLRQALALSVDKASLVEQVLRRGDRIANSFVPPGSFPGYEPPDGLSWDVERARALIREAGYADGSAVPPIELLVTPADERIGQALARMWREELGLRIELRSVESRAFAQQRARRSYMIARSNWYADFADATTFLDCLRSDSGNNHTGYANPRYDALLESAGRTRDLHERAALLNEAERIMVSEDVPLIPVFHSVEAIAVQPWVEGLVPNARLWFPFQHVSVRK